MKYVKGESVETILVTGEAGFIGSIFLGYFQ